MQFSKWCPVCKKNWPALKADKSIPRPHYLSQGLRRQGYVIMKEEITDGVLSVTIRWNACWHSKVYTADSLHETKDGYKVINTPAGYKPEHRYVWERAHGEIPKNTVIHHINGVKSDNRLDNLIALPRHRHNPSMKQPKPIECPCPHCGEGISIIIVSRSDCHII